MMEDAKKKQKKSASKLAAFYPIPLNFKHRF
jgi:hypothetical protein